MKKQVVFFLSCMTGIPLCYAQADQPLARLGKYAFPTSLADAFQEGLSVSVYLRYAGDLDTTPKNKQKIADAIISMKDGHFIIQSLNFDQASSQTELTPEVKDLLESLENRSFNENMQIHISDDVELQLDLKSLYLEMTAQKSALGTKLIKRSNMLEKSTSSDFSSILNYRFGSYYNEFDRNSNTSSYLSLDSVSSIQEHHFSVNGSLYGIGTSDSNTELYRALYERDFEGRRFAAGLMDTWSMQSIASLNALNSSKIYGVSYGNQSQSIINDNTQSLTPVIVFLPTAGTVQVYRDGRLLSIQNLPVGSQEVDTSTFPYGSYAVEIKTIVNGEVVNTTTAQINKTMTMNSSVTGVLGWQLFGGLLQYNKRDNNQPYTSLSNKDTWLLGAAFSKNYDWMSGLALTSTLYGFDENVVGELEANVALGESTSVNAQAMFASDSSASALAAINYSLPNAYGNLWVSRDVNYTGDKLYLQKRNNYSLGTALNLKQFHPKLGLFSLSYSKDLERENTFTNMEYNQHLYTARYAEVGVRVGLQNNIYDNQQSNRDKYIYFDVSLPISKWFSAGVSSRNHNLLANASLSKSFENQTLTHVGLDILQPLSRNKDDNSGLNKDLSVSAYANYEAKYNTGSISASATGDDYSINYSSQGTIAFTPETVALGNSTQKAGVVIKTNLNDNAKMSALINGQTYTLSGKTNFIPLEPYKAYTVELANDKNTIDSVDIVQGRKSTAVLYPGNISTIKPEIKQMVTVFGRLHYPTGEIVKNKNLHNHIGKTKTDDNGEFSLDVDKRFPVVTFVQDNGSICESNLDIRNARGAVWMGDIQCTIKEPSTTKNLFEARNP